MWPVPPGWHGACSITGCPLAGPGISSYADDPAGAGASLKPCLDKAMKIVPAEQQRETPTYLGATAGMRLLRYWHCPEPRTSDRFPTRRFCIVAGAGGWDRGLGAQGAGGMGGCCPGRPW